MAARLGHTKNSQTELLTATTSDGDTLTLCLSGYLTIESTPWFEWIDASGNPVSDIMDTLSINPNDEIDKITRALNAATQPAI